MFETAIGDGTKKLGLQQEIAETSRVNTNVATLLIRSTTGNCKLALLGTSIGSSSNNWRRNLWLKLLVGVVDEILLSRHGVG